MRFVAAAEAGHSLGGARVCSAAAKRSAGLDRAWLPEQIAVVVVCIGDPACLVSSTIARDKRVEQRERWQIDAQDRA